MHNAVQGAVSDVQTKQVPLYETIYEVLRQHLAEGRLTPGLVLGEANVARAFRASRIPAAVALKRLRDEGLVIDFGGRGYMAAGETGADRPLRAELADAGLTLPDELNDKPSSRNLATRIYPEVEHAIAVCLAHGKFMVNESALAEYFRVSRTVAHEVLTQLARTGIIVQEGNQRWYAGPLTSDGIREHYEMRWLLEPVALRQAFPTYTRRDLETKRDRIVAAASGHPVPRQLERIEHDLHVDMVARANNSQLRQAVRRSQHLLIASHSTFEPYQSREEIANMLADHLGIYRLLLEGDIGEAAHRLEAHLRRSLAPNIEMMGRLGELPEEMRRPWLAPVGR